MDEDEEDQIDFEALLRAMAPPATPADALALDDALENSLAGFDPLQLVIAIAGLQTDRAFQAKPPLLRIANNNTR